MNNNYYPYGNIGGNNAFNNNLQMTKKTRAEQKKILWLSTALGFAFLLYMLLSELYSRLITGVPVLYNAYSNNLDMQYLFEIMYSFTCVGLPFLLVFALLKISGYEALSLPFGKVQRPNKAVLLVFAGLGLCFAGSLFSSLIVSYAKSFGIEFYSYRDALEGWSTPDTAIGAIILIFHSAFVPALIEEFAFRGVVMQSLRRYGDWFAIIVSAVLFGFMHANFTQVPFAVIAGIALGFATIVTGSMWTGIVIHFLNNFVSVLYSFISNAYGESAGWMFSTAVTYGFILLGILAIIVYAVGGKGGAFRLHKGKGSFLKNKPLYLFLSPMLLITLLWLLQRMLTDIVGLPINIFSLLN